MDHTDAILAYAASYNGNFNLVKYNRKCIQFKPFENEILIETFSPVKKIITIIMHSFIICGSFRFSYNVRRVMVNFNQEMNSRLCHETPAVIRRN